MRHRDSVSIRAFDDGTDLVLSPGLEVLVCVDNQDPIAGGGVDSEVARSGKIAVPLVVKDAGAESGSNFWSRIGGARVDYDDFVNCPRQAGKTAVEDERLIPNDQTG